MIGLDPSKRRPGECVSRPVVGPVNRLEVGLTGTPTGGLVDRLLPVAGFPGAPVAPGVGKVRPQRDTPGPSGFAKALAAYLIGCPPSRNYPRAS